MTTKAQRDALLYATHVEALTWLGRLIETGKGVDIKPLPGGGWRVTPAGAATTQPPTAAGPLDRSHLTLRREAKAADMLAWSSVYHFWPQDGWGSTLNNERQGYLNANFAPTAHVKTATVEGGELVLTCMKTPADIRPLIGMEGTSAYPFQNKPNVEAVSGMRHGKGVFTLSKGYIEIECKLPNAKGMWPAFWLCRDDGAWPPEIDIFEVVNNPKRVITTLHDGLIPGGSIAGEYYGIDSSDGFHRYGALLTDTEVIWYVDDREVFRQPASPNVAGKLFYPLIDLAWGGWPEGDGPVDWSALPIQMRVRSVKAYDLKS